jgi:DNA repair exonuclease SbcCD nuclease subunit
MKRGNKPEKNVVAILTGDWHLREDQPVCREDNHWDAQWQMVDWFCKLQKKYNVPIIHSGDVFDHWKPSPRLLGKTISCMPEQFYTVAGNHDLPQHNVELYEKCGLHVLEEAGTVNILWNGYWLQDPEEVMCPINIGGVSLAVWHVMVWNGNTPPWPGCTDLSVDQMLAILPDEIDVLLTGHNHKSFQASADGKIVLNPGSPTIQSAAQIGEPRYAYLLCRTGGKITIDSLLIPEFGALYSTQHLDQKKEKDARYEAFISQLKMEGELELDFEANLERYFQQNKVKRNVRQLVMDYL